MRYAILSLDEGGVKTWDGYVADVWQIPDDAEVYDNREEFEDRLAEIELY